MKNAHGPSAKVLISGVIAGLLFWGQIVRADFTFGEPVNLGPTANTTASEYVPCISADGLELYFASSSVFGFGGYDIWVCTRETKDDEWGPPENLGAVVNGPVTEWQTAISTDGLELYIQVWERAATGSAYVTGEILVMRRAAKGEPWGEPVKLDVTVPGMDLVGGPSLTADGLELHFFAAKFEGGRQAELYVTKRETTDAPWGEPVSLGPAVNDGTCNVDGRISSDGLLVIFADWWACSSRPGGLGGGDMWMARRTTRDDDWGPAVNLGPAINSASEDQGGTISADGSTMYFHSNRPGGSGWRSDLWQAPVLPVVDFDDDGTVGLSDLLLMIESWGTDDPLCDIGPMPWGDGVVDAKDLIVLAEHMLKEIHIDESDNGSQLEFEQGQTLVLTLESNPTTGYQWEQVEGQESVLQQMGEAEYKPSDAGEPPLPGAGGWEIFRFRAAGPGQMTLQMIYHRPWEEGVEPLKTFSIQIVVR